MKPNLRISVQTLLDGGKSQREIEWVLAVDRKTIRRIEREAKSPGVATGIYAEKAAELPISSKIPRPGHRLQSRWPPPRRARSIASGSRARGRSDNATSIYQDLAEKFGFTHRYNSVKRFVAALKAREPERFDVLDALPGEEVPVDFGQGALTRLPNAYYHG